MIYMLGVIAQYNAACVTLIAVYLEQSCCILSSPVMNCLILQVTRLAVWGGGAR